MKRFFYLFLLLFASTMVSGQDEIWGYNALMGSEGGGLVYKVDLENDTMETIHSFGFSYDVQGSIDSPLYKDSGYIYGITSLPQFDKVDYHVFKYNIESKEFNIVTGISSNTYKIGIIDEQYIYFYRNYSNNNYKSYVLKYDRINNIFYDEKYIPKEKGAIITGPWIRKDNKFYFLTQRMDFNTKGTLLEYNPQSDTIIKKLEFGELKKPIGSLIIGGNDEMYGHTYFNGEFDLGGIFKINEELNAYEIVQHFSAESGGKPYSEMIKVSNETFYGFNSEGGEYNNGSIYKYNTLSGTLETAYSFDTSYHFNNEYRIAHYLIFDGNRKIYFYSIEHQSYSWESKYLYSFDIINQQVKLELDYAEESLRGTSYNLISHQGNLYTNTINDTIAPWYNGIYKYNFNTGEISSEYVLRKFHNEENGMFPMMMCQGGDGNIYGLTNNGGKNNKGIAFEIDYYSHKTVKLFDLDDTHLSFSNYWNSKSIREVFVFETDHILGQYWDKEYRQYYIFDFNTYTKTIDTLHRLPYNYYTTQIERNSDDLLYYINRGEFYEYDYYTNQINKTILPDSIRILSINEWSPNIYYGVSWTDMGDGDYSVFKWNRETNELDLVFGINKLKECYNADGISEVYVTENQMLFGSFWEEVAFPGWDTYQKHKTFIFNLQTDSIHIYDSISMGYNEFHLDFNTKSTNSIIEIPEKNILLNSLILADEEIEIIDTETLNSESFALEKSPFTYTFDFEPDDYDLDSDAPFEGYFSLDFFKVNNPQTKNYWLGRTDSIWNNTDNWANQKAPLETEDIYISKRALYFPNIDTLLKIGNLFLEDDSKISIAPTGALSCITLDNKGQIIMSGNQDLKASLVFEELEEKGNLKYIYQPTEKDEKLLSMPVSDMKYSSFDSLPIWKYADDNWFKIEDSSYTLSHQNTYKFETGTTNVVQFQGNANTENIEFVFHEKGLQAIPNPYAASLFWDELNLSNLSHKAHYCFIEEDSVFVSYVNGLGTSPPLVQPLDVVWVMAEANESIELKNEDRIHARQFENAENLHNNKLSLNLEGKDGKDITHIRFNPNSTSGFDKDSDAFKLILSEKMPSIFTLAGQEKLSINQLPDTSMLNMAISTEIEGKYTISIHENINFDFVVLEDLVLNTKTDLLKENYDFEYFTSDGNYPFKLYFKNWVLEPLEESDVEIFYYPESVVVRSKKQVGSAEIIFYDLAGRVAEQYTAKNFFKFEQTVDLPSGHYIVQLRTSDLIINKKVLIRK